VWSVATVASGLAARFWQLFLARMGVGVGEAVLNPAAMSLIADLFPKEKRGFAVAVVGTANYLGGGLALLAGGAAIAWVTSHGSLWAGFKPWQVVFLVLGLPGLVVALLMLTIVEPRHQREEKPAAGTLSELGAFLRANWFVVSCHFVGFSLEGTAAYAVTVWGPTFFIRHFHFAIPDVSLLLGPFLLVAGPLGGFIGGWLVQHWTRKGRDDAPMLTGLIGSTLVWIFIALAPLMPTALGAGFVFALSYTSGPLAATGALAAIQLMTPPKLRAQVVALYFFVVTIIGIIGGASIVAFFTDNVFRSDAAIGSSIALTAAILGPIMSVLLFLSLKPFRQAVRASED
jgi:MFS family permease